MSSINRIDVFNVPLDKTDPTKAREVSSSEQQPPSGSRDSIALSGTAKEIDRLANLFKQAREERIGQIRQMLDSKTYSVSSEDIARKLIQSNWR
jgi:anti-sigma28 factor (negative regulator of flagellin synthesis)